MNYEHAIKCKSKKCKDKNQNKNTRKHYKKGGTKKIIASTLKSIIPKAVTSNVQGKPFISGISKHMINRYNPRSNAYIFKKGTEDLYNQSIQKIMNADTSSQTAASKVDVKKAMESSSIKPSSKKQSDKVKFSELASEGWLPSVNNLTHKINETRQNAKNLLYLNELVDEYNKTDDEKQKEEKWNEIFTTIRIINKDIAKKYNINNIDSKIDYIPNTSEIKKHMQQLKKEATFTYNLLKNIDLSPKEIQTAYCEKWTEYICKRDDTPMMLIKRMLYYYVFTEPSHTSNIKSHVVASVKRETKPTKPSSNMIYSTYVPGYGVAINPIATVKTVYGAIFGFDDKWLDNILGILDPIVNTIFNEIKDSENGLDFITLLVSSMSGKTEEEINELFKNHANIGKFKDNLNKFLKDNALSFAKEYKNTHFIGISDEFQTKITTAATEKIKSKVAEQILTIANGLRNFKRELLLFIINANTDMSNYNIALAVNKETIDELQTKAGNL